MFSSNGYEFLLCVFLTNPCQASYLQKAGFDVCVLERRNVVGGAAVTEELVPGLPNTTVTTYAIGRSYAPLSRSLEHGPCSQTHTLISWCKTVEDLHQKVSCLGLYIKQMDKFYYDTLILYLRRHIQPYSLAIALPSLPFMEVWLSCIKLTDVLVESK